MPSKFIYLVTDVIAIILLACSVHAQAREVPLPVNVTFTAPGKANEMDKLIDDLVERVLRSWPLELNHAIWHSLAVHKSPLSMRPRFPRINHAGAAQHHHRSELAAHKNGASLDVLQSKYSACGNAIRETGTVDQHLEIMQLPEDEATLRTKSSYVGEDDMELVTEFAQTYLLQTMYEAGGIGIASIQTGLPLKLFIVDIPEVQVLGEDGAYEAIDDVRYLGSRIEAGESFIKEERTPEFQNGHKTYRKRIVYVQPEEGEFQLAESPKQADVIITRNPVFFINPVIKQFSLETVIMDEGCLSVPGAFVEAHRGGYTKVQRPVSVTVEYVNDSGKATTLSINGDSSDYWKWFARCLQHEFDHTEGILFTDKVISEDDA